MSSATKPSRSASASHLVLLPSYNTGPRLVEVVRAVLARWPSVMVVIDGSTDGSGHAVRALAETEPGLTVLELAENSGKGAAVLAGGRAARERGFTHALVMDADGQHPEDSIAEFMAASLERPDAMILGRPIFPPNIPPERLHGRKLSVGMVRLEMLGQGIDDPLFGFRVLPLEPLLAILGPRRGGRRYDFDTEAAVRLAWAGVPPVNIAAPVRYFSKEEGGISHFHYLRDNLTLVGMHARLLGELLFLRWPALRRHRRAWQAARLAGLALAGALWIAAAAATARAAEPADEFDPAPWADLAEDFAKHPGVTAEFTERRHFPFRRTPVILQGEVRVAADRGLSLRYLSPERRTVIMDDEGLLVRTEDGAETKPADPRAASANAALLHVLRFDFAALKDEFELSGERAEGGTWNLTLVPRDPMLRRGLESITVGGEAREVRRIVLRRSAKHTVEIAIAPPRSEDGFTDEDLARYFRRGR